MIKTMQIAPAGPGYQVHYFELDPRERVTPGGTYHPVVGWVVDERGRLGAAFVLDGKVHSTTEWDDTHAVVVTVEPPAVEPDERFEVDWESDMLSPLFEEAIEGTEAANSRLEKMLRAQGVTGRISITHSAKGDDPRFPPIEFVREELDLVPDEVGTNRDEGTNQCRID